MKERIAAIYRHESRRVFATLVRLLGDLDLAEDVLQEAFLAAMKQWPREGVPDNPRAWLVSVGRFKAIDRLRRQERFGELQRMLAQEPGQYGEMEDVEHEPEEIADDRLRLIFTCCHPALAMEVRVALTLREVCGLSTERIADAFLVPTATLAQRLVRGKAKIRKAGIPYEVPDRNALPARLDGVLAVVYLVYNEGYQADADEPLPHNPLAMEAIRLGRLLRELLDDAEIDGLLALMLLQESRRAAHMSPQGDPVLLEAQDRRLWDQGMIDEGLMLLERAMGRGEIGPFTLQAAIAAEHARAPDPAATDWSRILALYDLLQRAAPSPVVALNRAVAVAMREGPETGLALIDELLDKGQLRDYLPAHASRADLCRRLGRKKEAAHAYRRALELARRDAQRRFLSARLAELN